MWTPLRLGSTAAVMTSCVLLHLVNMAECVAFEKIIWLYSGALLSAAKTPPAAGSPLFTNSNVTTRGHVFYFIFYFSNALTMKNLIRCVFRSLIHQVKSNKVHVFGCVFFLEVVIVLYCFLIPFIFHWFSQCFLNCPAVLWSHLSGLVWPEPQPEAEGETFVWQNSSSSPSVSTWFCEGWGGLCCNCESARQESNTSDWKQTESVQSVPVVSPHRHTRLQTLDMLRSSQSFPQRGIEQATF